MSYKQNPTLAVHVHNQGQELKRLLLQLARTGFDQELIVVVIGGEDPYELTMLDWPFRVKTLYIERSPGVASYKLARSVARTAARGKRLHFLELGGPQGFLPAEDVASGR